MEKWIWEKIEVALLKTGVSALWIATVPIMLVIGAFAIFLEEIANGLIKIVNTYAELVNRAFVYAGFKRGSNENKI